MTGSIPTRISKHTPGPWRWRVVNGSQVPDHVYLETEGGEYAMSFKRKGMNEATPCFYVNGIQRSAFEIPHETTKATHDIGIKHPDARLIAAAPQMLAALVKLNAAYDFGDSDIEAAQAEARAAIAAALGDEPAASAPRDEVK